MTIFVLLLVVSILLFIMTHYEQKARLAQEYNQKAENAAAANEAKSAFLSNMSHEIRTPIDAVPGMNEMILRESSEPNVIEYSENIRTAGNTLLGLINDIYVHSMGDKFLMAFANVIKRNIRAQDVMVRIGGDEFMGFFG